MWTGEGTGSAGVSESLSVVIPVHDEQETILSVIDEVVRVLSGALDFEIVVVDDGSRDDTAARLASAGVFVPRLRVLTLPSRRGQSAALLAGVRAARGRWIATLDGDGQNDPADLPGLLSIARRNEEPTMVCGERRLRRDPWVRRVASRVANGVRSRALGDGVTDTGCSLKVMPRDLVAGFPTFDHMHRFLPALARCHGATLVSVPVSHRPRGGGRSKYGVLDRLVPGIVDLFGVWWLTRRALPPPRPVVSAPSRQAGVTATGAVAVSSGAMR